VASVQSIPGCGEPPLARVCPLWRLRKEKRVFLRLPRPLPGRAGSGERPGSACRGCGSRLRQKHLHTEKRRNREKLHLCSSVSLCDTESANRVLCSPTYSHAEGAEENSHRPSSSAPSACQVFCRIRYDHDTRSAKRLGFIRSNGATEIMLSLRCSVAPYAKFFFRDSVETRSFCGFGAGQQAPPRSPAKRRNRVRMPAITSSAPRCARGSAGSPCRRRAW
jgi:hypothetical protein